MGLLSNLAGVATGFPGWRSSSDDSQDSDTTNPIQTLKEGVINGNGKRVGDWEDETYSDQEPAIVEHRVGEDALVDAVTHQYKNQNISEIARGHNTKFAICANGHTSFLNTKISLVERAVVRKSVWDSTKERFQFAEEESDDLEEETNKTTANSMSKSNITPYSELPPYPTRKEDLTVEQLRKAQRRKNKFLCFARSEVKYGEVAREEVVKIEATPVEAFYVLNLLEQYRYKMGHYPFAPMGRTKRKRERGLEEDCLLDCYGYDTSDEQYMDSS